MDNNQDKVQEMMNQLCLDDDPSTKQLITTFVNQAEVLICDAIDSQLKPEMMRGNPIYELAVSTLVTELYYERTLPNGEFSNGLRSLINHLKGRDYIETKQQ